LNKNNRGLNLYFLVILILLGLTYFIGTLKEQPEVYTKAQMEADLQAGKLVYAEIYPNKETPTGAVEVTLSDGSGKIAYVSDVKEIEGMMAQYGVSPVMNDVPKESWFMSYMLPMLVVLIIGVFFFAMMNSHNSGGGGC